MSPPQVGPAQVSPCLLRQPWAAGMVRFSLG
jgi:hypothetical protein